ncbi:hypothetical protein PoB_006617200 [Plakobranchus ocellatus]|uniref:Uncharacterized protein n=1 Tax=Plakobranchus ocellatus TaxID=259542 RepID=A0AAV4D6C9_9GAST|nr:hypothetical protein PoB_006617200 [Plakobranchus ocellatus]
MSSKEIFTKPWTVKFQHTTVDSYRSLVEKPPSQRGGQAYCHNQRSTLNKQDEEKKKIVQFGWNSTIAGETFKAVLNKLINKTTDPNTQNTK